MTDEELDRAVIAEAQRRLGPAQVSPTTPTPPVDRWTLEAREVLKARHPAVADNIDRGVWDETLPGINARSDLQRGYEIGKAEANPVREVVEDWAAGGSDNASASEYMGQIYTLIQAEKEAGK